jgi:hypothetical protein
MIADSEILTYIFLGFVAVLFVMIFVNVLGGPRKNQRVKRGAASEASGIPGIENYHLQDGSGDDGGGDGGGGDGGD